MKTLFSTALLCVLLLSAPSAARGDEPARSGTGSAAGPAAKIQWFGTLEQAQAEAARTGRPILLTSAAPQCSGTPGIW